MSAPAKTATGGSFDAAKLGAPKVTSEWARESAGRPAVPVPANILNALQSSKRDDTAQVFPAVPGAPFEKDDKGQDTEKLTGNSAELVRLLRRGAEKLGYGVKIKVSATENGKGAHVAFKATTKRAHDPSRPRKPTRLRDETDPEYAARMAVYRRDMGTWESVQRNVRVQVDRKA